MALVERRDRLFLSLEGLRGVLALLVCVGHLGLNTVAGKVGWTIGFRLAVDVFFALSGFVMCHSNYFGRRTFDRFFIGRIARLYPLHLLTLLAMVAMAPYYGERLGMSEVLQAMALLHNIGLPPDRGLFLNGPSWSISVELWVSVLFFVGLQTRRPLRFVAPVLACLAIAPALIAARYLTGESENVFLVINIGLLRGNAGFGVGVIAFLLFDRYRAHLKPSPTLLYLLLLVFAALFCVPEWTYAHPWLFYAVVLAVLVFLPPNDGATVLSSRPMVMLGAMSYSIYLLHFPILTAVSLVLGEPMVRGLVGKTILMIVILGASYLSYAFIEMPSQRIILRAHRMLHRPAQPVLDSAE